eukprot:gene794-4082_t
MARLIFHSLADERLANDYYWVDEFRNEIVPVTMYNTYNFRGLEKIDFKQDWKRVEKSFTTLKQIPPDTKPYIQYKRRHKKKHENNHWKLFRKKNEILDAWWDEMWTEKESNITSNHQYQRYDLIDWSDDWKRVGRGKTAMEGLGVDVTRAGQRQSVHEHDHRGLEEVDRSDDWKRVGREDSYLKPLNSDLFSPSLVFSHDFSFSSDFVRKSIFPQFFSVKNRNSKLKKYPISSSMRSSLLSLEAFPIRSLVSNHFKQPSLSERAYKSHSLDVSLWSASSFISKERFHPDWVPTSTVPNLIRPLPFDLSTSPEYVVFRELERLGFAQDWNSSTHINSDAPSFLLEPQLIHPDSIHFRSSARSFAVGNTKSSPPLVDTVPLPHHTSQHQFRSSSWKGEPWRPTSARNDFFISYSSDVSLRDSLFSNAYLPEMTWDYANTFQKYRGRSLKSSPRNREKAKQRETPLFEALNQFNFRDDSVSKKRSRWNSSTRVSTPHYDMSIIHEPELSPEPYDNLVLFDSEYQPPLTYSESISNHVFQQQLRTPTSMTPSRRRKKRRQADSYLAQRDEAEPIDIITSRENSPVRNLTKTLQTHNPKFPAHSIAVPSYPAIDDGDKTFYGKKSRITPQPPIWDSDLLRRKQETRSKIAARKKRLSSNALERLSKLRELMEKQEF